MTLLKQQIEYAQTNFFSKIILDYLSEKESVRPFYKYAPSIQSFQKVMEEKSKEKINRIVLVDILKKQNANIPSPISHLPSPILNNIELLEKENTFTITTAHQPNLFTGYLYFFYKIISTINLSGQLKIQFPQYNFVPVFWLNTEDHDFAEINHIHLFGKKTEWKTGEVGNKQMAVGKLKTNSVRIVLEELEKVIGKEKKGEELLKLFREAYLENENLADATRFLVNHFFGKYGLVVIDSDDKNLKQLFSEIMEDELKNQTTFQIIHQTNQKLGKCGYAIQAKPREINLFYLKENSREKIEKLQIAKNPERFSPNVLLRCLYQEKVLPNLAYIGGGGELAYWLQLKNVFENYKINFPVLLLRNSVLWIDKSNMEKLKKFGFVPDDLFHDVDFLINKYLARHHTTEINFEKEKEQIRNLMKQISEKAKKADGTLEQSVLAEEKKMLESLENIQSKITKAEKRKHETEVNQIKSLKEKLFPAGELQERHDNFIPYYLKYGDEFVRMLKENLDVFKKKFYVFLEE